MNGKWAQSNVTTSKALFIWNVLNLKKNRKKSFGNETAKLDWHCNHIIYIATKLKNSLRRNGKTVSKLKCGIGRKINADMRTIQAKFG